MARMVRRREGKNYIYKPEDGNKVNIVIEDVKRKNGTEVVKVYVESATGRGMRRVAAVPTFRLNKVIVCKTENGGKEVVAKLRLS